MNTLHRYGGLPASRRRPPDATLREVLTGVSVFMLSIAACLYAVAQLAP